MSKSASHLSKKGRTGLALLLSAATLGLVLTPFSRPLLAEDEGAGYVSHFERESDLAKWVGRPGSGKSDPKLTTGTEGAKEEGKTCLFVTTDGKLGSGFRLKPFLVEKEGKTYVLSFWFKSEGRFPVTYHLTGAAMGSHGEASGAWHALPQTNGWTQVNYAFVPSGTSLGLEIAAGAEEYEPAKMSLYDVQIKPE